MNPIGELVTGGWILRDWLGKGGKIADQKTADNRAEICVTCPENRGELWWERQLKDPIAEMMRRQLELKNSMQLRVENEGNVHCCRICGCCIRLVVWQTDGQIRDHTSVDDASKYPEHCWKRKILLDQKKSLTQETAADTKSS